MYIYIEEIVGVRNIKTSTSQFQSHTIDTCIMRSHIILALLATAISAAPLATTKDAAVFEKMKQSTDSSLTNTVRRL